MPTRHHHTAVFIIVPTVVRPSSSSLSHSQSLLSRLSSCSCRGHHHAAVFIVVTDIITWLLSWLLSGSCCYHRSCPHAQPSSLLRSHLHRRRHQSSSGCHCLRCCDPRGCCPHAAVVLEQLRSSRSCHPRNLRLVVVTVVVTVVIGASLSSPPSPVVAS